MSGHLLACDGYASQVTHLHSRPGQSDPSLTFKVTQLMFKEQPVRKLCLANMPEHQPHPGQSTSHILGEKDQVPPVGFLVP